MTVSSKKWGRVAVSVWIRMRLPQDNGVHAREISGRNAIPLKNELIT